MTLKTADIVDSYYDAVELCNLNWRRYGLKTRFQGEIQTVKCFEDNSVLKKELSKAGKGRVLVVDAGGSTRIAVLGDMIAAKLIENGWAGIIINGVIRDSEEISKMNIGVKALGTSPIKSIKRNEGQVGIQIQFGSVRINPGQFVYSDLDGVLISETNLAET